ncbi:hypothetical protein [Geobacter sp.]|uniref:hypothetical protein n=1 Tax=Geobacter sp. TaxID=46610 RepID=UPI0026274F54|nr:hypothetical protein [Geobacter sp.]
MTINKKIQEMAVFIEFLVGSGLAIFFHTVLNNEQAAYVIFAIGILLSLVTYLVREDIAKSRADLLEQYRQVHEIPFALAQIADPECQAKAHELIAGAKRTITLLQQGFIPLDETEFYHEGAKLSDQATRQIKAVDPLTPGWWSRGALLNLYQANLRALDRGVRITRIFVLNREELPDPEVQKVLLAQHRGDIGVRVAFRDELPATNDIIGRDTNCSFDFAIYDDRAVTEVFAHPGKHFGRKTAQPSEVARYQHLYELIEHSAHPLTVEGDRVILASDAITLAS